MGCNFTSFDLNDLCIGSNGRSQRALSTRTFSCQLIGVVSCYYVPHLMMSWQKQPHFEVLGLVIRTPMPIIRVVFVICIFQCPAPA